MTPRLPSSSFMVDFQVRFPLARGVGLVGGALMAWIVIDFSGTTSWACDPTSPTRPARFGAARGQDARQGPAAWPTDVVRLADDRVYRGWITEESSDHLTLREIVQRPGKRAYLRGRRLPKGEIASVERLEDHTREDALAQYEEYRQRHRSGGKTQTLRTQITRLLGPPTWRCRGSGFQLLTTVARRETAEAVARRLQLRLVALEHLIPPRVKKHPPLEIILWDSAESYREYLSRQQGPVGAPAVFNRSQNRIVAFSELEQVSTELEQIRLHHHQLKQRLEDERQRWRDSQRQDNAELTRKGASAAEIRAYLNLRAKAFRGSVQRLEREIAQAERQNQRTVDNLFDKTLSRMFHELLHAHLDTRVFPQTENRVPVWLHEGIAQVVQDAPVEGAIRLEGSPRRSELAQRLLAHLQSARPLSLETVLLAGPEKFSQQRYSQQPSQGAAHPEGFAEGVESQLTEAGVGRAGRAGAYSLRQAREVQREADYYLYAWGLADYLVFRQKVLQDRRLCEYVSQANRKEPLIRFEQLVGINQDEFLASWKTHLRELSNRR